MQEINAETDRTYSYIYTHPNSYEPLAQVYRENNAQRINYYHCDQIGIPREITDEQGNLRWFATYGGWGKLKTSQTLGEFIHQPLRLQNQYADKETGLHYNFFRYYDPMIGRFINQDPIGLAGGMNLYRLEGTVQNVVDQLGLIAPAIPLIWEAFVAAVEYVAPALAGILIAAGISDITTGKCEDPCANLPSRAEAKRQALDYAGLTEKDLLAKRPIQGWEQYAYDGGPGTNIQIVSHHPADKEHPCPNWHVSEAKLEGGDISTFNNGAWRYRSGGPVFPHRFN